MPTPGRALERLQRQDVSGQRGEAPISEGKMSADQIKLKVTANFGGEERNFEMTAKREKQAPKRAGAVEPCIPETGTLRRVRDKKVEGRAGFPET